MNTSEKLQALIELGMSQHDIERETGISQASISRIIGGKQSDPKESTAALVHSLYNKAKRRKKHIGN